MQNTAKNKDAFYRTAYPALSRKIPGALWQALVRKAAAPADIPGLLQDNAAHLRLPPYAPELAEMERHAFEAPRQSPVRPGSGRLTVNPTLKIFQNTWRHLSSLVDFFQKEKTPEAGQEMAVVWRQPTTDRIRAKAVTPQDLLVLKMALEKLTPREVAQEGRVPEAAVQEAVVRALDAGILIRPGTGIVREFRQEKSLAADKAFDEARAFTIQWHITQACDLHCRHCYDRNAYASLSLNRCIPVLDDMVRFCNVNHVHGQITFTGGNPLLYPDFAALYRAAAERGFTTAILGNPASREEMERIVAIQPPAFFQVSLEGLEPHNDYMRGKGHFQRILAFLDLLRSLDVYTMVMLTLTRENMDQVLALAKLLGNRADQFTFNRLSLVGEGASLVMADPEAYRDFLVEYVLAADDNPILGLKDNLINILLDTEHQPVFGGCTGHGCGAAFNFLTILADGEVHACRKFPSPLGNILTQSLGDIYFSETARKYREGPGPCRPCRLRSVCRGCLAVSYSLGLDIFAEKDPYCFSM
jgi:selenobiotic family peptide radical SAM maturase